MTQPRLPRITTGARASSQSCISSACAGALQTAILWLPASVLKAFTKAKSLALLRLADTAATKVMLPFVEEQLLSARKLLGEDYWSYGYAANQLTLENFLRHHHAQGLSQRLMAPHELFHPSTHEAVKV